VGFFFIPLVGSILAIAFGSAARRRIAEDPDLQGAEMARAGIIIGWIGLVLIVLVVIFVIIFAFALQHSNI
jgi:flagellar biosynthesis/type III secretory pathway M-ring protein FliF/YscJ